MRILVTGGAGFIGSHTVDLLIERGHKVVALDDMSSGHLDNLRRWFGDASRGLLSFVQGDITDWPTMHEMTVGDPFDAIVHLAAQPSLRRSLDDPAFDATVNILGTLNVIQAAKRAGVGHVVLASTSAVYAEGPPTLGVARDGFWLGDPAPFRETDPVAPNLPYGIAKAAAEMYLRHSGLSHTILRYGNVYGPRQRALGENQLVPHVLGHLLGGQPFTVHGDGEQTRDFVYVGDIARANVLAAERRPVGTFNAGTGAGTSVHRVCAVLAEVCGWPGHHFDHGPAKPGEMRHSVLDSRQAAVWGWRAETSIEAGLARTLAAWQEKEPVTP